MGPKKLLKRRVFQRDGRQVLPHKPARPPPPPFSLPLVRNTPLPLDRRPCYGVRVVATATATAAAGAGEGPCAGRSEPVASVAGRWMVGWLVGWVDGRKEGWKDGWTDGLMNGWMDGWMDGWIDEWMDWFDELMD